MNLARFSAPVLLILGVMPAARGEVSVDLSGYRDDSGVGVRRDGERLTVSWPLTAAEGGEHGRLVIDLRPGRPLVESMGVAGTPSGEPAAVLKGVDPVTFVTVGTRVNPPDRPPGMSVFNVFFDSPAKRPHEQFRSTLDLRQVRVTGRGGRATVALGGLKAGPFSGGLEITVYKGARLVQVEAVVSTEREDTAFLYDAGLASASPDWTRLAWLNTEGAFTSRDVRSDDTAHAAAVRHRAIVAEADAGSVACFPPPHQFFYPRDDTDNQKTAWYGRNHRGLDDRTGFGVRQTETGGGNFAPWFNAPPGTAQRLGVFYLLSRGRADEAMSEVLKFTHGDRFPEIPGRVTFTSHWHMAVTLAAMKEIAEGKARTTPDFVTMFKAMNVNVVHLAEFHGDGHPRDPGPIRLAEMKAMFGECQRLSDNELVFLPGEEANAQISARGPGRETGHWLYLFPRPVYWTMTRAAGQPFRKDDPKYGTVYHVGSPADMVRLLETERGLGWTAHPRIKSSNFTPDAYRGEAFYRSDVWLGAAWKAMPADLSSTRLGVRVLDLFDDMANWGQNKYVPGEVDVFKIDHTHELYGHMNVNYLRLDRAPRFEGDWTPVLDALRHGRFFVTTGEVLLKEFTVGGKPSGETLRLSDDGRAEVKLALEWTFPMRFAEVISGDGRTVYRERVDLSTSPAFDKGTYTLKADLKGRTWVRFEAWDVAGNGTFSQPVWLEGAR
ncbi:MAG: hypothetical protein LC745_00675 [Planctomycetia bacterium]|nr:hypothetical protein [Planctomycetia bacterium]